MMSAAAPPPSEPPRATHDPAHCGLPSQDDPAHCVRAATHDHAHCGRSPQDDLAHCVRAATHDHAHWELLRLREFPGERLNLNAGTLGTPARSVLAAQQAFWGDELRAWPLGQYRRGRAALARARALVAELWGPTPVALTGGASEAMTRLTLALHARLAPAKIRVLTSGHEHPGGVQGFLRHPAFEVIYLADEALADPAALAEQVLRFSPQVLLLSQITYCTGQLLPIAALLLAARAASPALWTIVDAAQAVGLVAPALADADAVVTSGHKWLFGPPGSGLVWLSERARLELAPGWAGEALDPDAPAAAFERAGGQDLSLHAGMAAALALHAALGPAAILARSQTLAAWFAAELHARLRARDIAHTFFDPPTGRLQTTPPTADRLIGAVHVQFPDLDPYPAYAALDARGIHLKCIKSQRPTGARLSLLRFALPCHESFNRLAPALDAIAAALAGAP